jgi:hypothetical protein
MQYALLHRRNFQSSRHDYKGDVFKALLIVESYSDPTECEEVNVETNRPFECQARKVVPSTLNRGGIVANALAAVSDVPKPVTNPLRFIDVLLG